MTWSWSGSGLPGWSPASPRPPGGPPSMNADWEGARVLVVGLDGYRDFQAELVAAVLPAAASQHGLELVTRALTVDLPGLHRRHLGGLDLARQFQEPGFRRALAAA